MIHYFTRSPFNEHNIMFKYFCSNLLVSVYLLMATTAFAELSAVNSKMIQRGIARCEKVNNELTYTEYWGDSVAPENLKVVCIAEKFAHQAAAKSNAWMKNNAGRFIDQCKEAGKKNKGIYYGCLNEGLSQNMRVLSSPCRELGREELWSEQECKHLINYIFMTRFQVILKSKMNIRERIELLASRISGNIWLRLFVNPISATLIFMLLVYDVLYLIRNGSWMYVSKVGLIFGPLLLLSCFTKGGMSILSSGAIIIIIAMVIFWNHQKITLKLRKKKPKPIKSYY